MMGFETKLNNGEVCLGGWQQIPSAVSAEAMCSMDFDWICVDLEHSRIGAHQVEDTVIVAELYGVAPFARLPNADPYVARKLLDSGLSGLIVAGVEDPESFAIFANHCSYPQEGIRGVGLSRSNRWGDQFNEQIDNFKPILVPQIESINGVEAASEIADIENVAALFLGPYDLSASLGGHGVFNSSKFTKAKENFLQSCEDKGVAAGIHQVDLHPQELEVRISEGFRLIAYGTDILSMRHGFAGPYMTKQKS